MVAAINTRGLIISGLLGLALAGCTERGSAPPAPADAMPISSAQVRSLHGLCVEAMVRSACVAMKDSSASNSTPASPVVMLAGVGAVDARFYAKLRAAGETMCEVLVQPCEESWDGSECRTARALWSAP
jgi:hypothetical protein